MSSKADDWRDQLSEAVAFRMMETHNLPKEEAQRRVDEVAEKGSYAEHFDQVSQCTVEMFRPVVGAILPQVKMVVNAVSQIINSQIARSVLASQKAAAEEEWTLRS